MHLCIYIYICIHLQAHVCVHACVYVYVYVYVHACVYMCISISEVSHRALNGDVARDQASKSMPCRISESSHYP